MKLRRQKLPYKLLERIASATNPFTVVNDNTYTPVEGAPIIFAVNHSNRYDMPVVLRTVRRPLCFFMGKQRLGILDRLFFFLSGSIFADRLDRKDTNVAKEAMVDILRSGHSLCWFPEGTWNVTENLLMLPMKWGIIEVAKVAGAQIIPVALEYDREHSVCQVLFGRPMTGSALEDKAGAIETLRNTMATLRWELISIAPTCARGSLDIEALRATQSRVFDEYPPLQWEYERQCIFHPPGVITSQDAFAHLKRLRPRRENAFLFSKRWSG